MTEIQLHGVFLKIDSAGVLLTGAPGIGKSSIALGLIDRGHQLIADDLVIFNTLHNKLIGHCPMLLQDQLKIRSVELLNIRKLYGSSAISLEHGVDLIIHLENTDTLDLIEGNYTTQTILEHSIPKITLSPDVKCNLALLVECIVRNFQARFSQKIESFVSSFNSEVSLCA